MKESGPEKIESRFKTEAKNAGFAVAVFTVMLGVTVSLVKVMKEINPPEVKYKIAIKTKPSKEGEAPFLDVKLVKQCVDSVVHASPSTAGKTFYKDCE